MQLYIQEPPLTPTIGPTSERTRRLCSGHYAPSARLYTWILINFAIQGCDTRNPLRTPLRVNRIVSGRHPQTFSSIDEKSKGKGFSNDRPRCRKIDQLFDISAPRWCFRPWGARVGLEIPSSPVCAHHEHAQPPLNRAALEVILLQSVEQRPSSLLTYSKALTADFHIL